MSHHNNHTQHTMQPAVVAALQPVVVAAPSSATAWSSDYLDVLKGGIGSLVYVRALAAWRRALPPRRPSATAPALCADAVLLPVRAGRRWRACG